MYIDHFLPVFFLITTPLQAVFGIYDYWEHPQTGQVVNAYYDIHFDEQKCAVTLQQHEQLRQVIAKVGSAAHVVLEDLFSLEASLNNVSRDQVPELFLKMSKERAAASQDVVSVYPMGGLRAWCGTKNISCFNAEYRIPGWRSGYNQAYEGLSTYNDTVALHELYKKILQRPVGRCYPCADDSLFEVRVLHGLYEGMKYNKKKFFVAVGASHRVSINNGLHALGFVHKQTKDSGNNEKRIANQQAIAHALAVAYEAKDKKCLQENTCQVREIVNHALDVQAVTLFAPLAHKRFMYSRPHVEEAIDALYARDLYQSAQNGLKCTLHASSVVSLLQQDAGAKA